MFSFLKQKVHVSQYFIDRLEVLFRQEQTNIWKRLLKEALIVSDQEFNKANIESFIDDMRAVHIQLLRTALAKEYRSFEMHLAISSSLNSYLTKTNNLKLSEVSDLYNQAFGSSSTNGIFQMVALFSRRLIGDVSNHPAMNELNGYFYMVLRSIFDDLDRVKLTI